MTDEQNFFQQPVKYNLIAYDNNQKNRNSLRRL